MSPPLLFVPLGIERRFLAGAPELRLVASGMGPERASKAARAQARSGSWPQPARGVGVAGVAGAVSGHLRPGTVVVASSVLRADGSVLAELPAAPALAGAVSCLGLPVAVGPVLSYPRPAFGRARADLAQTGALAVDCESAYVLKQFPGSPAAVLRVISDAPGRELWHPGVLAWGYQALRNLRAAVPALSAWAKSLGPRRVLLAGPRSFCAGVERAIATVEAALERHGSPVYVRRQIVHNQKVVSRLADAGAVFVQELDEVPERAVVVLSAHGVSPAVRRQAAERDLVVIDATCPLVGKVHKELLRFEQKGYQVLFIGHAGHDETEGTLGESERVLLIETPEDAERVRVEDPTKVAYVTQTTLSPADVASVVEVLSSRFPDLVGPSAGDICYATQNRQEALSAISAECDLVLVAGSSNSSNAARLVEVAARAGARAHLVEDEKGLDLAWLEGAGTVGISAAASTPPEVVEALVSVLGGLGPLERQERTLRHETVNFPLPLEVR